MSRRHELIDIIQALSIEEGTRQPSAGAWLAQQDHLAAQGRETDGAYGAPGPGQGTGVRPEGDEPEM